MFMCVWTAKLSLYFLLVKCLTIVESTQDQTSPRANTLSDDADDIQRQLDNEARDRIKYGRPKTVWVLHFPTQINGISRIGTVSRPSPTFQVQVKGKVKRDIRQPSLEFNLHKRQSFWTYEDSHKRQSFWTYDDQVHWRKDYPSCGGRSQSPVDLPYKHLITVEGGRPLIFKNFEEPVELTVFNDGRTVLFKSKSDGATKPFVYGGAARSRRYIFHSVTLHWPSEHSVGGLQYPLESQFLHISAEYRSYEDALNASWGDPQAFLSITNLYKYENTTHHGLTHLLKAAKDAKNADYNVIPKPMTFFNPPFKEYASYHGSLTVPPCKESVLWLVRARALTVTRDVTAELHKLIDTSDQTNGNLIRKTQSLHERRIFYYQD